MKLSQFGQESRISRMAFPATQMVTKDNLADLEWLPPENAALDDRMVFTISFLESDSVRRERHPFAYSIEGDVRVVQEPFGMSLNPQDSRTREVLYLV